MASVIVLGAGVSGHTAALHLRRKLARAHDVVAATPGLGADGHSLSVCTVIAPSPYPDHAHGADGESLSACGRPL